MEEFESFDQVLFESYHGVYKFVEKEKANKLPSVLDLESRKRVEALQINWKLREVGKDVYDKKSSRINLQLNRDEDTFFKENISLGVAKDISSDRNYPGWL